MKLSILALSFVVKTSTGFVAPSTAHHSVSSSALHSTVVPTTPKTKAPVFDEVCETTGVTLTRFMTEVAMLNPELRELTSLYGAIETSCKAISNLVKRSQLPSSETLGYQGEVNVQGEDQKKLDVITNDLLKRALRFTGRLGVLASEEEDEPVDLIGAAKSDAEEIIIEESEKYVVVFDPLDGSSNVDAGIPTGKKKWHNVQPIFDFVGILFVQFLKHCCIVPYPISIHRHYHWDLRARRNLRN